tara:strand:+ start:3453 stop:3914 length:462 start_codon:yes stop_codon:yes gene_type:complete
MKYITDIIVNSVRNNPLRARFNGVWTDVKHQVTGETLHNPQSVTIELQGHLDPDVIASIKSVKAGKMVGSDLLAFAKTVCDNQNTECKLQIEPDADYRIVLNYTDNDGNEWKNPRTYRHSGYTDRKTGEFAERTYLKFEIPRADRVGTPVKGF